jgi:DNA-binding transcriptional LysR family regulator
MELSDLTVFRTVVQAGGVTRAAQKLHRVQSNVTTRVRKLEQELGVDLFVRAGRRMQLSAQGKVLLEYADRILALADEARSALRDETPRGVLRLGAMESTAAVRLPAPLSELHRRHPELAVELHSGNPPELLTQLLAGSLDAALVAEPVHDPRLDVLAVYDEELVVVTHAAHPSVASARDLSTRKMLAFHPGCPHRKRLEEWFARSRVLPDRIVEMASYHAILGCAVVGMGVALLPRSVLEGYAERGRLGVHPLKGRFRSLRTLLVWRKDTPQAKVSRLAEVLVPARRGGRAGPGAPRRSATWR